MTTHFYGTLTHGFAAVEEPHVAVCLLPGAELAFEEKPHFLDFWRHRTVRRQTAIFCQIDKDQPDTHHDALEFDDGQLILLNQLEEGHYATVLQLPNSSDSGNRIAYEHSAEHVG